MILEIVRGFMGARIITDSGIKMPIGNMIFNIGDPVYTDGEYAFGHSPERGKFINYIDAKELCFKIALFNAYTGQEAKIATFTVRNNKIILVKNEDLDITKNLPRFYFSADKKTVGFNLTSSNPENYGNPEYYGQEFHYYFNGNYYTKSFSNEVISVLNKSIKYPYSDEINRLYGGKTLFPYEDFPVEESDYYYIMGPANCRWALFSNNKFIITFSSAIRLDISRHEASEVLLERTPTESEVDSGCYLGSVIDMGDGKKKYRYKTYILKLQEQKTVNAVVSKLSIDLDSFESEVEHFLMSPEEERSFTLSYSSDNIDSFRYSNDLIMKINKGSQTTIDIYYNGVKELTIPTIESYDGSFANFSNYISDFIKVIRISDNTYIVGDQQQSKLNLIYEGEIIDSYDLGQFTYLATNLSEAFLK